MNRPSADRPWLRTLRSASSTRETRYGALRARFTPIVAPLFWLLAVAASGGLTKLGAQAVGTIEGYVYADGTRTPLPTTRVAVASTGNAALTDTDGFYRITNVTPGAIRITVTRIGYKAQTVSVNVAAGATIRQDISLPTLTVELGGVTIEGLRGGLVRSVQQKRDALSVVDAISADEIGKLPDLNVAETAQRIPGVTIRTDRGEGRFVSIRGTAPNRNNVTFNGQVMASAAGTRATALDLVPAEMVASIEVQKAVTPDMDANSLGGSVNIKTLTAFDRPNAFVSGFLYGINHQLTTDFGERQLPFRGNIIAGSRFGPDDTWGLVVSGSASRRTFNTTIASPAEWVDVDGVAAPIEFARVVEDNDRFRYAINSNLDWRPNASTKAYAKLNFSQFDEQFQNTEVIFAGDDDPVPASATQGRLEGFETQLDIPTTEIDEQLSAITLGLDQQFGNKGTLNLYGTFSQGLRNRLTFQPEWGENQAFDLSYDVSGDFERLTLDNPAAVSNGINYVFTEMDIEFEDLVENTYQLGADHRWDFRSGEKVGFLKFGGAFRLRDKDIDRNEDPWAAGDLPLTVSQFPRGLPRPLQGNSLLPISGSVNDFLDFFERNRNGGEFFNLDPIESAEEEVEVDAIVTEDVYAGYAMGNVVLGPLTLTGGVRVERTTTTSERYRFVNDDTFDNAAISLQSAEKSYTDVLPSLHAIYRVNDRFQIRGAWSNTLGRPDYDELASFQDIEFEELEAGVWAGAIEEGNPDLEPLRSMNFDVSLEFYPGPGSLLSFGAFHKRIDNPIYTFQFEQRDILGRDFGVDIREIQNFDDRFFQEVEFTQLRNADAGSLSGLEVSYSQLFSFLPGRLRGLGLSSNVALMSSSVTVPGREDEDLPFADQSNVVYNIAPFYQYGPIELRAAFNFQGAFLSSISDNAFDDEYGDDRFTVDLTARYSINNRVQLNAYARNLTNEAVREYQGVRSRRINHELTGRTLEFGVSINP